jgi:uncharacterized protein
MLIDLYELLQEEDGFRKVKPLFETKVIKTNKSAFSVKDSDVEFTFHNEGKKHISFTCMGHVIVSIPCDRCLEPVECNIELDYFKDLDLNKTKEQKIAELDEEVFLEGTKFDSEVFIYNEILVNLPMKVLCSDDCKGICNRCGANLNKRSCQCKEQESGTGMSKILDVFNQFKEV